MTLIEIATYAALGIAVIFAVLAHSDPLTGKPLYVDIKESWEEWRANR